MKNPISLFALLAFSTSAFGQNWSSNGATPIPVPSSFPVTRVPVICDTNGNVIQPANFVKMNSTNGLGSTIPADMTNAANHFAGTFSGNGANLAGVQASSWTKILSLTPPANGDTNWFGPWTPGTQTAGIQEAINALPRPANPKSPGGGKIALMPGTFHTATNISLPTTNAFYLTLEGAGMLASGIVYTNTTPQNVLTIGSPNSLNGAHFRMSDLFVASVTNACTNIVFLNGANTPPYANVGGVGEADIERCWIGWWTGMTNATVFSPDSPGLFTTERRNLIGLNVLNNYGSRITVKNNAFGPGCIGLSYANDQGAIEGNLFIASGIDEQWSLTNDWPVSSPYKAGFACYLVDPNLMVSGALANNDSWSVDGNRFVIAPRTVFYFQNASRRKAIFRQMVEGNGKAAVARGALTFVNPEFLGTMTYYQVTNSADYTTWNSHLAPSNMVSEVRFDGGITVVRGDIVVTNAGVGTSISSNAVKTAILSAQAVELVVASMLTISNAAGGVGQAYLVNTNQAQRAVFGVGPAPHISPYNALYLESLGNNFSGGNWQLKDSGNIQSSGTNGLYLVSTVSTAPIRFWVGGQSRGIFQTNGTFGAQSLTASNFLSLPTNYVAANFTPVAGQVKLVPSNNWMFAVSPTATNAAFQIGQ
jgi:hypothetical protein